MYANPHAHTQKYMARSFGPKNKLNNILKGTYSLGKKGYISECGTGKQQRMFCYSQPMSG